jgi:predicted PurR-regulated permease PerM
VGDVTAHAAVFCMVALRLAWLLNKPLLSGLIYGVMIFLVMNYVIVPLSAIGRAPQFSALLLVLNLAAMLLFGVIISMSAHRMMGPGS